MDIFTWPSKHSYQFRRAASVIGYGDDVAQRTFLVLPHGLEDVDEIVGSTSAGEDHYAFCFGGAHRCTVSETGEGGGCANDVAAARKRPKADCGFISVYCPC
jgi:hypothetical protein